MNDNVPLSNADQWIQNWFNSSPHPTERNSELVGLSKEEVESLLDENLAKQQNGEGDLSDLWTEEDQLRLELESR